MSFIWNKRNEVVHEVKPVFGSQRAYCHRSGFEEYSLYKPKGKRLCKECRRIRRKRESNKRQ